MTNDVTHSTETNEHSAILSDQSAHVLHSRNAVFITYQNRYAQLWTETVQNVGYTYGVSEMSTLSSTFDISDCIKADKQQKLPLLYTVVRLPELEQSLEAKFTINRLG